MCSAILSAQLSSRCRAQLANRSLSNSCERWRAFERFLAPAAELACQRHTRTQADLPPDTICSVPAEPGTPTTCPLCADYRLPNPSATETTSTLHNLQKTPLAQKRKKTMLARVAIPVAVLCTTHAFQPPKRRLPRIGQRRLVAPEEASVRARRPTATRPRPPSRPPSPAPTRHCSRRRGSRWPRPGLSWPRRSAPRRCACSTARSAKK